MNKLQERDTKLRRKIEKLKEALHEEASEDNCKKYSPWVIQLMLSGLLYETFHDEAPGKAESSLNKNLAQLDDEILAKAHGDA